MATQWMCCQCKSTGRTGDHCDRVLQQASASSVSAPFTSPSSSSSTMNVTSAFKAAAAEETEGQKTDQQETKDCGANYAADGCCL
ncbi:hypothetical protein B0H65DRAFT_545682 [Neurospora tetraspora]|uniref:Uncharacterized protein n=1 Tax=Neurospora tetraspora TaxID=94610 RepID=A0AAE0JJT8_9PEZI|nr:hypothetical protein B0H65DRAFT_545682 [Neurospora tetraspora]